MNISGAVLLDQYQRAHRLWSFIDAIEKAASLPPFLLYAVGSRETSLDPRYTTGSKGDGGHGHGLMQLDDRWHSIPPGFDLDAHAQADTAAAMLARLVKDYRWIGDWTAALNAYNSGQPHTEHTTGGDYGPDVLTRRWYLLKHARST